MALHPPAQAAQARFLDTAEARCAQGQRDLLERGVVPAEHEIVAGEGFVAERVLPGRGGHPRFEEEGIGLHRARFSEFSQPVQGLSGVTVSEFQARQGDHYRFLRPVDVV